MSVIVDFYVSEKERTSSIKSLGIFLNKPYAKEAENGIYCYSKQYCMNNSYNNLLAQPIYKDVRKNIIYNFEQGCPTVKKIIKKINKNKYNAYNLAFLRPEELDEDNWIKIITRRDTTEEQLNNLATITWKPCGRCKCTDYSYYQLQTRSIDEPMTTFYVCKQCGKQYSVNV